MSHLLINGDARRLPSARGSVHCVVTSVPYWGLRDYGTGRWEGGDPACDHRESSVSRTANSKASSGLEGSTDTIHMSHQFRDICGKCGARRVDRQLGLEPTPAAYVAAMVAVFREVRRVLRDDGTLWLNVGDSYARNGGEPGGGNRELLHMEGKQRRMNAIPDGSGLKPKDLVGIPWMLAFALRDDGWWLRSEIIWAKPNPMPESVTDRPTKAHEQVFLLTKSERYYYDAGAVREPHSESTLTDSRYGKAACRDFALASGRFGEGTSASRRTAGSYFVGNQEGRNLRSVWSIPTEAYPGAHFATFPRRLVEPCVKAGSPIGGIVLDPFAGSGTTLVVATALGRRALGCDLSAEYLEMARRRIEHPHAPVARPGRDEELPLFLHP